MEIASVEWLMIVCEWELLRLLGNDVLEAENEALEQERDAKEMQRRRRCRGGGSTRRK